MAPKVTRVATDNRDCLGSLDREESMVCQGMPVPRACRAVPEVRAKKENQVNRDCRDRKVHRGHRDRPVSRVSKVSRDACSPNAVISDHRERKVIQDCPDCPDRTVSRAKAAGRECRADQVNPATKAVLALLAEPVHLVSLEQWAFRASQEYREHLVRKE